MRAISFVVLLFIASCISNADAQTIHEIYSSDTSFVITVSKYHLPHYDLKDSLPDGKWILYDNPKNRCKQIEGEYLNGKRTGQFIYYDNCRNKDVQGILLDVPYKEGKVHGMMYTYMQINSVPSDSPYMVYSSAQYENDERNGYTITLYENGKVHEIILYKDDESVFYKEFDKNGILVREW